MENKQEKKCLVCQATSNEVPIIIFEYQQKEYYICSQHIPVLIHKAQDLRSILPGIKDTDQANKL